MMGKQNVICSYNKYDSAIKRNEVLMHITIYMNLKNIVLSEGSQTQKNIYSIIPFI
jgi:hypothetical protein